MRFDALVIGGSFAGLSAAMQLARARRRVCVVDAGAPRNRFADASHGFFGQDGMAPQAMVAQAREKLLAYPSVRFVAAKAVAATQRDAGGFEVQLDNGDTLEATALVLAFGVQDVMPALDGVAERWGATVLHCPYCHGYEVADRPLGVLYRMPGSLHQVQLIAEWGPATLFLNGERSVPADELAALQARGIRIEPGAVQRLEGPSARELSAVQMADGRRLPLGALFIAPPQRPGSALAEQLGCAFDEGPFGPLIRTDENKQTTVPRVYAAGDIAMLRQNATLASADGVWAGVSLHRDLVFSPSPSLRP